MSVSTQLHQANATLWMQRIRDQKESGLRVKDWCSEDGFTIHAFYYWKHILKEDFARGEALPYTVSVVFEEPRFL